MKLNLSSNGFKSLSRPAIFRVLVNYSTETTLTSSSTSSCTSSNTTREVKKKRDTLYGRISRLGDPKVSIVPILDQWIKEDKTVSRREVDNIIKDFKLHKRYKHALEISKWTSDRRCFDVLPRDIAIRLGLIFNLHGIEEAEKYFENIPKQSKVSATYISLLGCYTKHNSVAKAESLMQQIRESGFLKSAPPYNALLSLYSRVGQYEKLEPLMEEMNKKGIQWDNFTFAILLNAYANTSKIDEMEKILQRMEIGSMVIMDWRCYSTAANGYIKAGLIDKAMEMLKKSEKLITGNKQRFGYDHLITLYAAAGSKEDVYRIWNMYKSSGKVFNTVYKCMIKSLLKLDDMAGAEKILEEWHSGETPYDFRIPNVLISAYCKNGFLEKAEIFVHRAIEKGKKPLAGTWDMLAIGYLKDNQIPKAVEAIKAGFMARPPGWKPHCNKLLSYLKREGDLETAKELVTLLRSAGNLSAGDCERLLDYICDRNSESEVLNEVMARSPGWNMLLLYLKQRGW